MLPQKYLHVPLLPPLTLSIFTKLQGYTFCSIF